MGLFNRRKDEIREETTEEVTPPVSDVLLRAFLAGDTITREMAMTLPVVSGAVDFICSTIASMPVKLYKYRAGRVVEVEDDIRTTLLNGDTGDKLNGYQLKKAMVEDYLMGKGGYCYIRRLNNEVTGLFYVQDIYVTILKNFKPIFKDYDILVEGKQYRDYEFVKLLRNTKDGASGVGLTQEVSKALETAYQILLYQLNLVKTGGNKRGFLKSRNKLNQESINALKKAWRELYSEGENVVVLNDGLDFQESSNSSVEMQLNENKNTLAAEINNIFHIFVGDFETTFKHAIYPILKAFETALNRDLLLEKEKGKYFYEFDVKEIIKANLTERYQAYKTAKETGFMTINEIRQAENMNHIEGLDVVNVGLGAVLYDVNTHTYYTPNTDTVGDPSDGMSGGNMDQMLIDHELVQAYDASGNSAERDYVRYNDNHDAKTGRFAPKNGSGGSGGVILYHQTLATSLDDFSEDKRQAGLSDSETPMGIFLKDDDSDIGLEGKNQLQLEAQINNPFEVEDRRQLVQFVKTQNKEYEELLKKDKALSDEYDDKLMELDEESDKAYTRYFNASNEAEKAKYKAEMDEYDRKIDKLEEEYRKKVNSNAKKAQQVMTETLKKNGYDSVIINQDVGSFGRTIKSYVVFDKSQLKEVNRSENEYESRRKK